MTQPATLEAAGSAGRQDNRINPSSLEKLRRGKLVFSNSELCRDMEDVRSSRKFAFSESETVVKYQ